MIVHGRDCSNHKSHRSARPSVSGKINLKLFPLALTPFCKVRYLHCNLTKKQSHAHIFFVFQMDLAHLNHFRKHVWPGAWLVLAMVITLVFSWYWSKLPFRSATDVMPNYVNSTEVNSLFVRQQVWLFSACCGLTHSVVCALCIVVGNTRQCLLYVLFLFYVLVVVCYKK